MKTIWVLVFAAAAIGLSGLPAGAQQIPAQKPGDMPGPIDSLQDLQDTGKMVFKLADENNDGQISQKEAIDAGNLVVGGFFFRADQNGDGAISKEEGKQAADAFFATKPWLRYVVDTAKTTKNQERGNTTDNQNKENVAGNLLAVLDTNNDKQLQASELRQAVQTTIQGAFATADTNRDGQLTPAELNAAIAGAGRQVAQAAFQQADTDNNGQISQAEFEKAILEPARVVFKVADLNHDGQISQQEAQTARQVITRQLRALRVPEPSNSPRNTINAALGTQTQPAPQPAPANPPR
jgi:Ca2+-binding EF-hand superfamily protein